jgi:methylmalonyl-CoA/ethylmalonyl-CoA epimerase
VVLDRIDHVGIACHDLAAKIAFYESVFDLTVVSREVNEEQGVREAMLRVAAAPGGSSWIQLLEPLGPDTPVGRFIAKRGPGMHHVAFEVDDVAAELARLRAEGARLVDVEPRPGLFGLEVAFLHPEATGGVLAEFVRDDRD